MEYPKRKHPRLKDYDYSQNGAYYVTICVEGRQCILGSILADGVVMQLSEFGRIAKKYIEQIEAHYEYVLLVNYVIMPNHIHLLIQKDIPPTFLTENKRQLKTVSLETIIHSFKVLTTKEIGHPIWQSSFYEHIIRNHEDIKRISEYIDANPRRWRDKS